MNNKYELTDETKNFCGITLHRIRALRDIPSVKVKSGDLGGWIEKENNLTQDGDAWVSGNAKVYGDAMVFDDAIVCGNATVFDDAEVSDNAAVFDDAAVYDDAIVYGDAEVCGNAKVYGDAEVINFQDYAVHKNSWSSGRWFTYTRSNKMWKVGCFCGTGEELVKKAYADSELSGKCYEAIVRAQEAIDKAIADAKEAK